MNRYKIITKMSITKQPQIMKTLTEIKAEKQASLDSLLNTCGVFFAFSDEQFEKNKTPLKDGEKYVSIGAGGYMPKSKVDAFLQGTEQIEKVFKLEIKNTKDLRRQNIAYELANHEAYYTGEISDTLDALGEGYTAKEVWKVYNAEKNTAE